MSMTADLHRRTQKDERNAGPEAHFTRGSGEWAKGKAKQLLDDVLGAVRSRR
jgi:hypothetical protein